MSNFKSLQTKVETNLQAVLNASSMATNISKNSSLQTVIEKQLNILGFLERTNNVVKLKSTSFINKYKNLSNRAFVLDKQVTYSADDSLEDEVNYFPVFIQNIFHIDMASLIAGKEVQIDVPTVSDKPTYQNAFDSMSSNANKLFGTIAPEQNPLLINMAKLRIQKEMNEGKIYIYKTRPKIILLLKLLAVIVSLVGCVSNVILGVGMMLSRPMYTYDTGNAGGSLYGDAVMYFGMALILL
jgi:hypothetical protein